MINKFLPHKIFLFTFLVINFTALGQIDRYRNYQFDSYSFGIGQLYLIHIMVQGQAIRRERLGAMEQI